MLRNNLRATWSVINSIVKGSKTNNSSHIKELNINGLTLKEPPMICDALNEYFVKIGKNINDSVPQVNINFERYITGSYCGSMFFRPVSVSFVNNLVMSLKNKPADIESYSARIVKFIPPVLSPVHMSLL